MKHCFVERACDGNRRAERSLARDVRVNEGVNGQAKRALAPPFASAAAG
jgi:hypothetical protein